VHNVLGQTIRTLAEGALSEGTHIITWDGTNDSGVPVPGGIYLYRVRTANEEATLKMVLAR